MRDKPSAKLVWDGSDDVCLPTELGQPREDQLRGTTLEKLCEIAGRTCYDSFGSGRSSADYHEHLLNVRHLSVHEHATFTVELDTASLPDVSLFAVFQNRPGCWLRVISTTRARVTLNLRSVLEWDAWSHSLIDVRDEYVSLAACNVVGNAIKRVAYEKARAILGHLCVEVSALQASIVSPETDDERWVSLFLTGSRGFSHEQVRHGDFTAISQRSTRYVDESESAWVTHPLLGRWLEESRTKNPLAHDHVRVMLDGVVTKSQKSYDVLVQVLENWLSDQGIDKLTARKQARGAARGYLGNALYTEMLFTASVSQWRRMLSQRACQAADAEIRQVYATGVLQTLQSSRYGDRFNDLVTRPSPDGVGDIVSSRDPEV